MIDIKTFTTFFSTTLAMTLVLNSTGFADPNTIRASILKTHPPQIVPGPNEDILSDVEKMPETKLTLVDAVKKALDYSQQYRQAESALRQASDAVSKARSMLFPTIAAQASAIAKQNPTSFNAGSAAAQIGSANGDNYLAELTLNQPLYEGGAITSGLDLYKAQEDQARQNLFNIKQTVLLNVMTTYYKLANAYESLEAAQQNVAVLKEYLDITNHYAHIGRSRDMDKLQAQVNYSLGLADQENAKMSMLQAQNDLRQLLGENFKYSISTDFQVVIHPIDNITTEQAYEESLKANPTVRVAQLQLEEISYTRDVDYAQDLPNLALQGTAGYNAPSTTDLFTSQAQFYSVGLVLNIPIFSGLSSFAKLAGYAEQEYQAQRNVQIVKDSLRDTISDTLVSLRSNRVQLNIAEESVKEARIALEMATKGYQQGIASSTDVNNLQTTRYNAEKLFITTQFTYLQNLTTLRQLMGIDLEKAYVH